MSRLTYKDAGVDIDAGDSLVERIKGIARAATRPEVVSGIGGFSGLCGLPAGMRDPLLVSGTDGVGTKLKVAFATGVHDTVGIDLVAMCANDVVVTGAEPLFFLDYFATGKLDPEVGAQVVAGIAEGCRRAGCALLGGETAELPGFYADGEYDLAGFCVGVVERAEVKDGRKIAAGDVVLGLASEGVHSNGLSLARKAVLEALGHGFEDRPPELGGQTVGQALLAPTRIYVPSLLALSRGGVDWKGAAHITGGGLVENPTRCIPQAAGLAMRLHPESWPVPGVFQLIQKAGVETAEMRRTFNMGIGMMVVVSPSDADRAAELLTAAGEAVYRVGEVIPRAGDDVEIVG